MRRFLKVSFWIIVFIFVGLGVFEEVTTRRDENLREEYAKLSALELIDVAVSENNNLALTIGIYNQGQKNVEIYGREPDEYTYEIASIGKTFTAAMIESAIEEGKINLEDDIKLYLPLDTNQTYPTVKQLLTHTSGYPSTKFSKKMLANIFRSSNIFLNISKEDILESITPIGRDTSYNYSNFNYAVLGLLLESLYSKPFIQINNEYLQTIGLGKTGIMTDYYNLENYEDFNEDDGYLPAGFVTSNINDMLDYVEMMLNKDHKVLAEINETELTNKIGYAWHISRNEDIIWHNGASLYYRPFM